MPTDGDRGGDGAASRQNNLAMRCQLTTMRGFRRPPVPSGLMIAEVPARPFSVDPHHQRLSALIVSLVTSSANSSAAPVRRTTRRPSASTISPARTSTMVAGADRRRRAARATVDREIRHLWNAGNSQASACRSLTAFWRRRHLQIARPPEQEEDEHADQIRNRPHPPARTSPSNWPQTPPTPRATGTSMPDSAQPWRSRQFAEERRSGIEDHWQGQQQLAQRIMLSTSAVMSPSAMYIG